MIIDCYYTSERYSSFDWVGANKLHRGVLDTKHPCGKDDIALLRDSISWNLVKPRGGCSPTIYFLRKKSREFTPDQIIFSYLAAKAGYFVSSLEYTLEYPNGATVMHHDRTSCRCRMLACTSVAFRMGVDRSLRK